MPLVGLGVVGALAMASCSARPPRALAPELQGLLGAPGGAWGVYFKELGAQTAVEWNADAVFHAASTMKLLVLAKVHADVEAGRYTFEDLLEVHDEFPSAADGSPFRVEAEAAEVSAAIGSRLSIERLARWMVVASDNLATNLLIERAGGPREINAHAARYGLVTTSVARFIEDGAAFRAGLSSRTQPRELGQYLERLARGEVVSPRASRAMLDLLGECSPDWMALRLSPECRVAHKTGAIDGVRHDVGVISLPDGRRAVLCICSSGVADEVKAEATIAALAARLVEGALAR